MSQQGEVCFVRDAKFPIQPFQEDFQHVDLCAGKILIGTEKIPQEGDMPWQNRPAFFLPPLRLQHVQQIFPFHQVDIAPAKVFRQVYVLAFHIQADDVHAAFPRVAEQQLHEVALALAAVAEYEDVGIGLVRRFPPEVDEQVRAVLVVSDVEALQVGLPAVIEREQVARAGGGEDAFELLAKTVFAAWLHALKAFLLPEEQLVRRDLGTCQLRLHVCLHLLQLFQCRRRNLDEHRAVQQNLPCAAAPRGLPRRRCSHRRWPPSAYCRSSCPSCCGWRRFRVSSFPQQMWQCVYKYGA